jgi:hypothetical protein
VLLSELHASFRVNLENSVLVNCRDICSRLLGLAHSIVELMMGFWKTITDADDLVDVSV